MSVKNTEKTENTEYMENLELHNTCEIQTGQQIRKILKLRNILKRRSVLPEGRRFESCPRNQKTENSTTTTVVEFLRFEKKALGLSKGCLI
jgi:hypothetical protein